MKRTLLWLALLVPALFFESCIKSDYDPYPTPSDLSAAEASLVDSFTLNLETFLIDSLNSTSQNYLFAGSFPSIFGEVKTRSYFEFLPESYNLAYPADSNSLTIDSTVFLLRDDKFYGGIDDDTSSFFLKELTSKLDGDGSYYTANTFTDVKTDTSFVVRKSDKRGTIYRKKINAFGNRVMEQWKTLKTFNNDAQFLSYFHGFELTSPNPRRVTRFDLRDSSTAVTSGFYVYCRMVKLGDTVSQNYYFKVNRSTVQFYSMEQTRTGVWAQLQPKTGLSSDLTEQKVAMQSGTAMGIKIKLPGLAKWVSSQPGKIKIFKAELYIKPEEGNSISPPDYIRISSQDKYYSEVNPATTVYNDANILSLLNAGATAGLTRTGAKTYSSAKVFSYNGTTTKDYKCNITSYVQEVVDGTNTTGQLNLYPYDLSTSLSQMVVKKLPDQSNLKLKVYYYKI